MNLFLSGELRFYCDNTETLMPSVLKRLKVSGGDF